MKQKFIDYYMSVADITATLSYAKKLQVGAVIVRDNQIIATGYNGTPSGWDNNCEDKEYMGGDVGGWLDPEEIYERWPFEETVIVANDNESFETPSRYKLVTKPEVIHAESNAIAKLARSTENSDGAILFCTHAPCIQCAKLIYQAGIKQVYYREQYRDSAGLAFLEQGNIDVHHCVSNGC